MYLTELREQEEDILLRETNRTRPRAISINERVNFFTLLHIFITGYFFVSLLIKKIILSYSFLLVIW